MIYQYSNNDGSFFYKNTFEEAEIALAEIRQDFLSTRLHIFTIASETLFEKDAEWVRVQEIEIAPEDGLYVVFNPLDGSNTRVSGKTAAIAMRSKLIMLYCQQAGLCDIIELIKQPPPIDPPIVLDSRSVNITEEIKVTVL